MKIVAAVFLLASAAFAQNASAPNTDPSPLSTALAACGPASTKFQRSAQTDPRQDATAQEGNALVYVVEDQREVDAHDIFFAEGITVKLGLDGAWVGANENNSYLSLNVAPGEHHLCINWQSRLASRNRQYALAHLNAEAGKVYYFKAKVALRRDKGGEYDSLNLEPIDADEGRYLVALAPSNTLRAKK